MLELHVFSHDSSLGVQAPFRWVTTDDHLEQLNSKESVHFVSEMFFQKYLEGIPSVYHGIQGFMFELKSFKLTISGNTAEVCCVCKLWQFCSS